MGEGDTMTQGYEGILTAISICGVCKNLYSENHDMYCKVTKEPCPEDLASAYSYICDYADINTERLDYAKYLELKAQRIKNGEAIG